MKTWDYHTISGCLEARVGGEQVQLGNFGPIRDKFFWKGKKTIIHWGLFHVGVKIEPCMIAPDFMSATGYVRYHFLNKKKFHLWDFPADLWMQMNEEHLG